MQKSFFEQMGGTYTQVGDYLLPDLVIEEVELQPIGKYGRMRKRYLKEHRPVLYSNLLTGGKLYRHMTGLRGTHGSSHAPNGQAGRRERSTQSGRSNGMGQTHEQHSETCRRDHPARAHLRLKRYGKRSLFMIYWIYRNEKV